MFRYQWMCDCGYPRPEWATQRSRCPECGRTRTVRRKLVASGRVKAIIFLAVVSPAIVYAIGAVVAEPELRLLWPFVIVAVALYLFVSVRLLSLLGAACRDDGRPRFRHVIIAMGQSAAINALVVIVFYVAWIVIGFAWYALRPYF